MKVRLIIDGKTADLNEDGLILLTYQVADAEHPAAVRNSYSQNITLPGTATNDAIFSHILRPDFRTATGFNPLARTPFEIRNEAQEILVSGYVKLNDGQPGKSYSVGLFGGLGSFFFEATYNADGTKRSLADMEWKSSDEYVSPYDLQIGVSAQHMRNRYISDDPFEGFPYAFAPFSEGIPSEDFEAGKAYFNREPASVGDDDPENPLEISTFEIRDGVQYHPKNFLTLDEPGMIVEFSNEHDGWEMEEFRNTLQRPLWSIAYFLDAIKGATNYTVDIDSEFLDSDFVQKGYVTCRNDWAGKVQNSTITFADLLAGTQSPADYLLSIAKICGLMFICNEQEKSVRIVTRNTYYGELASEPLYLEGLLAEDKDKTITPILTSDKWQVLTTENFGARAADFKERKGRDYGALWIDTNYEFGGNENEMLSESLFKGAADSLGSNINYRFFSYYPGTVAQGKKYLTKFLYTDTVKYTLYSVAGAQEDFEPTVSRTGKQLGQFTPSRYNSSVDFGNVTELPELHDADGKAEDGSNVILFFGGMQTLPKQFFCTEVNDDMLDINDGKPCWDMSKYDDHAVTQFPLFQRQLAGKWSALFGRPGEFFTPRSSYYNSVPAANYQGERIWSKWLAERFSVDGRKMRCWVNLRTPETPRVDAELLRRFWYYQGAWWVLDKITSHSITTDELTECEFVKVLDMDNYTNGQNFE